MRILEGAMELTFHGETRRCPMAGVRDPEGSVEVAVATPFGLRRVHAELDAGRRIVDAHTFAFDYESGEVTRFDLELTGGPVSDDRRIYEGTVSGGGLQGSWRITELGPFDDADDEAEHAFGVGRKVPMSMVPAPAATPDED